MNRRRWLKTVAASSAALALGGTGYGFYEAGDLRVERPTFALPNLPPAFDGLTVAFLSDLLHGPYAEADDLIALVRTTLLLDPDLILLGGDYTVRSGRYVRPCFEALARLRAPLGVYGVLGTHDYWHGLDETRTHMRRANVTELTNAGVWLTRGKDRLRLAGVDDWQEGLPYLDEALEGVRETDACLLVSHNPAFADTLRDGRVGLMLSGSTHGGQVRLPLVGSPWLDATGNQRYRAGFVPTPRTTVYVSRGLGVSGLPVRLACRPELTLLTLRNQGEQGA